MWRRHKMVFFAIIFTLIISVLFPNTEIIWYEGIGEDENAVPTESVELQIISGSLSRQNANVRLSNNTQYTIIFGGRVRLERYRRGRWVRVRRLVDRYQIEPLAFRLAPGSYIEHGVSFQRSFGRRRLSNGTYRIVREISRDLENEWEGIEISAVFTIGRG